jgi:hypothetical protein
MPPAARGLGGARNAIISDHAGQRRARPTARTRHPSQGPPAWQRDPPGSRAIEAAQPLTLIEAASCCSVHVYPSFSLLPDSSLLLPDSSLKLQGCSALMANYPAVRTPHEADGAKHKAGTGEFRPRRGSLRHVLNQSVARRKRSPGNIIAVNTSPFRLTTGSYWLWQDHLAV